MNFAHALTGSVVELIAGLLSGLVSFVLLRDARQVNAKNRNESIFGKTAETLFLLSKDPRVLRFEGVLAAILGGYLIFSSVTSVDWAGQGVDATLLVVSLCFAVVGALQHRSMLREGQAIRDKESAESEGFDVGPSRSTRVSDSGGATEGVPRRGTLVTPPGMEATMRRVKEPYARETHDRLVRRAKSVLPILEQSAHVPATEDKMKKIRRIYDSSVQKRSAKLMGKNIE